MFKMVIALCDFDLQEQYAAHTIHVRGCIEPLMIIFKDNLIIIGLIAFGVGFVEVYFLKEIRKEMKIKI